MVSGGYGGAQASGSIKEILILFAVGIAFILILPKLLAYLAKSTAKEASDLITDFPLPEFGISEWIDRKFTPTYEEKVDASSKPLEEIIEISRPYQDARFGYHADGSFITYDEAVELGLTEATPRDINIESGGSGLYEYPENTVSKTVAGIGTTLKLPELGISEWFKEW